MSRQRHPGRSPLRPLVAGLAVALLGLLPFTPFAGAPGLVPMVAAADVTTEPSADPAPSTDPLPAGPEASLEPLPDPSPSATPTAEPTAEPTPDPTVAPDPTPSADVVPPPSAAPEPSAAPSASALPAPIELLYELSPGQQKGRRVGPAIPIYKLNITALDPDETSPHGGVGVSGSDCAACHSAHTAQQADLQNVPGAPGGVCYACHAGAPGAPDVASDFTAVPANVPASDRFFSHPLAATTGAGAVTCADCHNPHLSDTSRPAESTTGWTAGGPIAAAAGVGVDNGPAGAAPTYAPTTHGTLAYEYQLCLACHSGAATLPTRDVDHPSWWALDAGIEFNPANASTHPVEGVGRNTSAQMAASLAGTSPFKAWTFTVDSTIRCTSCHGDPSTVNQTDTGTPKTPLANALEASHGSPNRGLLTAPYRDRDLKDASELYDAADFALCYLCHAEDPLINPNVNPSALGTTFSLHGKHLALFKGTGTAGGSIDTAGAGNGFALCSECHFRSHSTALAYKPGDTAPVARATGATGLVNFAPNVVGLPSAVPVWNAPGGTGSGSCALTCHGYTHDAATDPATATYTVAPATGFTASPTSGSAGPGGLTVQFTDRTHYAAAPDATWSWTFGDGGSSSQSSPSHTYLAAGTFNVTLTVTRAAGDGGLATTMTRNSYIAITP